VTLLKRDQVDFIAGEIGEVRSARLPAASEPQKLQSQHMQLLRAINEFNSRTPRVYPKTMEVAEATGWSQRTVETYRAELKLWGLVEEKGRNAGWQITADGLKTLRGA